MRLWVALFLPGALARRRFRQITAALLIGAFIQSIASAVTDWTAPYERTLTAYLIFNLLVFTTLGFFEWRFCGDGRNFSSLAVTLLGMLGIAALSATMQVIDIICSLPVIEFTFPMRGYPNQFGLRTLLDAILSMMTWAWLTTSTVHRTARPRHTFGIVGTSAAAALILFFVVTHWMVFHWAQEKLVERGPAKLQTALEILLFYGSDTDRKQAWAFLVNFASQGPPNQMPDEIVPQTRQSFVNNLIRFAYEKKCDWIGPELDELLRTGRPEIALECDAYVDGLVAERRYTVVPQLLRADTPATRRSLVQLEVPQVAVLLLRQDFADHISQMFGEMVTERFLAPSFGRRTLRNSDDAPLVVSDETRAVLSKLLGRDVGPDFDDWYAFYDAVPSPQADRLSPELREEADRIVTAMRHYDDAVSEWRMLESRLNDHLAIRKMLEDGHADDVQVIRRLSREMSQAGLEFVDVPGVDAISFDRYSAARQAAYREIKETIRPPFPSLYESGTDQFDAQLDNFWDEIIRIERAHFPKTEESALSS